MIFLTVFDATIFSVCPQSGENDNYYADDLKDKLKYLKEEKSAREKSL